MARKYEIKLKTHNGYLQLWVEKPRKVAQWPDEAWIASNNAWFVTSRQKSRARTARELMFDSIKLSSDDAEHEMLERVTNLKQMVADWNAGTPSERLIAHAERLIST